MAELSTLLKDAAAHAAHHPQQQSSAGEDSDGLPPLVPGACSWQCSAAAVAAVASEVVFGASGHWLPPFTPPDETPEVSSAKAQPPDQHLDTCVQLVLDVIMLPEFWAAQTSQPNSPLHPSVNGATMTAPHHTLTAQDLGSNALMLRSLAEASGAAGRVLGTRLGGTGRTLRGVLIPLLERLADPCALVAGAAGNALTCISHHCGYGGSVKVLVSRNADYVVDAVCGQLRDLGTHPRAPMLLAALLRRGGGVGPELLPRMAEPLGAALRVGRGLRAECLR